MRRRMGPNRIGALLEMPPLGYELVRRDQLGQFFRLPQREALQLTQAADFPEPLLSLHSVQPNETLPQPQPVWDRSALERWLGQQKA